MDIFLSIARNGALLLSLVFLYSLFIPYIRRSPRWLSSLVTGALFGGFAILNMLEPLHFGSGVLIDPRNVILLLAAAVGGFRAALISLLTVTLYRAYIGGDGFWAGWFSMLSASLLGLAYQKLQSKFSFDRKIILLGLLLALESLLWTLALPDGYGWTVLPSISIPVLIVFPMTTYVMAWLIASSYQRIDLSAALQESETRFRAIFEQSIQFLCLMDADGTVRNISPSLLRISQLKPEQIIGQKFWEIPWLFMSDTLRADIKGGFLSAKENAISRLSLNLSISERSLIIDMVFQKFGETGQILMEARDMTEQMLGEKRRLELHFERERNDILQQLISDASHHLRTPLTIITSSLYLLRKQNEKHDGSPEWQNKMESQFKKLDSSRADLVEIVEDLLSMMQLDSPAAFRFERQLISPYLNEIIESYYAVAEEKQLSLSFQKPENNFFVSIVPSNFRRVIANLIENAIRYTPAGGKVTISLAKRSEMAEIIVEDTGIGIPEEELPRIFDRFYRAKNASSQSLKGTGLGLAIVKKTVEMHKGQIEISSDLGKGTRVTLLIPLISESVLVAS